MYEIKTIYIVAILFVSMAAVIEIGYWLGRWAERGSTEASRNHVGSIQASLLGMLALLLGFTFSLSLGRHESRSEAVVAEANAIGTTWLRSQLLPESVRENVRLKLREYLDLRVEAGELTVVEEDESSALLARTTEKQNEIWNVGRQAAVDEPSPVTTGLFIQSLNEMIDAFGSREAALNRHVPELVLFLLYGTFLMTGAIVGFNSGLFGHRTSFATYIMVGLIVVLVFIILDLDRPRRGLVRVSQKSLVDLQSAVVAELKAGAVRGN